MTAPGCRLEALATKRKRAWPLLLKPCSTGWRRSPPASRWTNQQLSDDLSVAGSPHLTLNPDTSLGAPIRIRSAA